MAEAKQEPQEIILSESDNVKVTQDSVEVKVPGKDEKVSANYERKTAKTLQGALELCGGDEAQVLAHFNYGFDLDARGAARSAVLRANQDPNVVIERTVKAMVAAGFDEAAARALVIKQRESAQAAQ